MAGTGPIVAAAGDEISEFADRGRIGKYVLLRTLGQGSFGKVMLSQNTDTGEEVALKFVAKDQISDVGDLVRVYRESIILTALDHVNIIKLYELVDTPTHLVLAMEYAGGGELSGLIKDRGRLPEAEANLIFRQIIDGVEYCHRKKVIHRDLKLENILLDKQGRIKIADFGLSNSIKFGQDTDTHCGTPAYMPPEQILKKANVGPAVDVWSMGVILFKMVAGFLPFEANVPVLYSKITGGHYTIPPYMSTECAALIQRMLELDPSDRISLSEIRSQAWQLMEYNTELVARIKSPELAEVSEERIAAAQRECQMTMQKRIDEEKAEQLSHDRNQSLAPLRVPGSPSNGGQQNHSRNASSTIEQLLSEFASQRRALTKRLDGHSGASRRTYSVQIPSSPTGLSGVPSRSRGRSQARPPSRGDHESPRGHMDQRHHREDSRTSNASGTEQGKHKNMRPRGGGRGGDHLPVLSPSPQPAASSNDEDDDVEVEVPASSHSRFAGSRLNAQSIDNTMSEEAAHSGRRPRTPSNLPALATTSTSDELDNHRAADSGTHRGGRNGQVHSLRGSRGLGRSHNVQTSESFLAPVAPRSPSRGLFSPSNSSDKVPSYMRQRPREPSRTAREPGSRSLAPLNTRGGSSSPSNAVAKPTSPSHSLNSNTRQGQYLRPVKGGRPHALNSFQAQLRS